MKNNDKVLKEYVDIEEIFAEIANRYLYEGDRILTAEDLEEYDSVIVSSRKKKEIRSDCRKFWRNGNISIGIENQSAVNYSMPVCVMVEDSLVLSKEISRFLKELDSDNISHNPVNDGIKEMTIPKSVSIVFYTGNEKWDGAESVSELFTEVSDSIANEEFKNNRYNHPMGFIDAKHMSKEEISKYHGDVKVLFKVLNFDEDENKECNIADIFGGDKIKYKKSYEVMSLLTGDERYIKYAEELFKEEGDEDPMCGLLDYVERRGRMSGVEFGLASGKDCINRLNAELAKRGRVDDILKSATDPVFQSKLIKELNI